MATVALGFFWLFCFQMIWYSFKLQKKIDRIYEEEEEQDET